MPREPALCARPPRDAPGSNIAAVMARRLFTRPCSPPTLPYEAVAVGLRCWTADSQTLFLTPRWRSVRGVKASAKIPRSFSRHDPVFDRDSSSLVVFVFSIKLESTRFATSPPFYTRPNRTELLHVTTLLPPARAPLQKTPTGSTGPGSFSSTLTHVFQATSAPVTQEEDATLRDRPVVTPWPSA